MPLITDSQYDFPPLFYRNPHISTIYTGVVKKVMPPAYQRVKCELSDGDFLNIDFVIKDSRRAVILSHGLEGNSRRTYINSSANYFLEKDFSVFAWNNRSCGGEMNRLQKLYHQGAVYDLDEVIRFVLNKGFQEVFLMGFSMGGGQIMNYFGTMPVDTRIKAGVAVSTLIQLRYSTEKFKKGINRIYMFDFKKSIVRKLQEKASQFPDFLNGDKISSITTFDEIDDYFTAPLHGYINRFDYYRRASPEYVMHNIRTPLLVINAADDPFLTAHCYPVEFAGNNEYVYLEIPRYGGHCSFPMRGSKYSYAEIRAHEFFNSLYSGS